MHVPTDGWINGGWNTKLHEFRLLAEMTGLTNSPITPEDLQNLFKRVDAKVFADNVQPFLEAAGDDKSSLTARIEKIERMLGTTEPLPFMSMKGQADPAEFSGVAIWPTGTANWTKLRLEQIEAAHEAGVHFRRIICLSSSRVCNTAADRLHPLIAGTPAGDEPTEQELQHHLIETSRIHHSWFRFPKLPEVNDAGRPLSLEQQLKHLQASGQYDELIEDVDIYVPSTPNSLYVPLHVRRVLGHDNVWFSQAGARLVDGNPDSWWPSLQQIRTLPSGIVRLWIELVEAGCITK